MKFSSRTTALQILCTVFLATCFLGSNPAAAQPKEYKLKAAFLYNFIKFISWPETSVQTNNPKVKICIIGPDPFGPALKKLEKEKRVFNKAIDVIKFTNINASLRTCNLAFISHTNYAEIIDYLDDSSVLTIGEKLNFIEQGGMIGFTNRDGRIRFEINISALENSGLAASSKLLELAERAI